jgi:hypothetical protein
MTLDWTEISIWTDAVVTADLTIVRTAFQAEGATGPEVIWSPEQLASARLQDLLSWWQALRRHPDLPAPDSIDPLQIRPALGYVLLLDVVDDGEDFRYRLFGSTLSEVSGFDMTGRLASEHEAGRYVVQFGIALYRAVMRRRQPVFTAYGPAGAKTTESWHRLVLPFAGDDGRVLRFLSCNIPIGTDGRPLRSQF